MGFGPILNAGAVADLSTDCGDTVLCDVRWYLDGRSGLEAYEAGHLPGAVFVDLDEDLTGPPGPEEGRHPLPSAAAFARSMGELGIGPDDTVVAYDDSGGMSAGRLVWMPRVLGEHAALLDGGITAWDGALEALPTVRTPGDVAACLSPARIFLHLREGAPCPDHRVPLHARPPALFRREGAPLSPPPAPLPFYIGFPLIFDNSRRLATVHPSPGGMMMCPVDRL